MPSSVHTLHIRLVATLRSSAADNARLHVVMPKSVDDRQEVELDEVWTPIESRAPWCGRDDLVSGRSEGLQILLVD